MQWIPLKPSAASDSGKSFHPIPERVERPVTGRTDEGQSRRIVLEVCFVKRPLSGVVKITKTWSQVFLRGQGLRQEQQDGANHKLASRAQGVDA